MDRALQPILLGDDNEARGALRWELLRKRLFEPLVDTIENQTAYATVINYHLIRLLDGINRLQSNVRVALGLSIKETTEQQQVFEAQMFAEGKAAADTVNAKIKAEFDARVRDRCDGTADPANDLRGRVWSVLHVAIYEDDEEDDLLTRRGKDHVALSARNLGQRPRASDRRAAERLHRCVATVSSALHEL